MCAFRYWLALITKPFPAVGNNVGSGVNLIVPARFARDSLIGMHFTCTLFLSLSPTIGCSSPNLRNRHGDCKRLGTVVSNLSFECEIAVISNDPKREILERRAKRIEIASLINVWVFQWSFQPVETWKLDCLVGDVSRRKGVRSGERDFWQIFCQASLSNDRSYKGLAVTRLGYNLYR